jgi:hypothetical protein
MPKYSNFRDAAVGVVARVKQNRRVAIATALVFTVAPSFAQTAGDGSIDTTTMLAAIAGGVAAAIVVSVAYTTGKISVKASKLPRAGA